MINFGLVPSGAVLPVIFDSFAGATGASVTISGLAVTDIEIYKGTSTTQRSSDAGYALIDTDGIDIDGTTGVHGFSIDTGDNTDAGFYAVGSFFTVVVSAITVDSQTVNFVAATFRMGPAEAIAGKPKVDVDAFGGTAGTFSAGIPEVKVNNIAANAITATSINADAITAAKVAADVHQETIELAFTYDATATYGTASAGSLVKEISDNAGGAGITSADLGIVDSGTAQSATSTGLRLRAAAGFANDELIGAQVLITGGSTGVGQTRTITDYVGATDDATVDAWTVTPTGTITYKVFASAPASATALPLVQLAPITHTSAVIPTVSTVNGLAANVITAAATATDFGAEIADAVWDEATSGHTTAGTTGKALTDAGSAGDPWSTALPGAYSAGTAGKIIGDNINATVSSRASQTSLDTVDDLLDTEVAAIISELAKVPKSDSNVTLNATVLAAIADAMLDRNMATGTDSGSTTIRTPRQALRAIRNKWSIAAGTLTVLKEDDSTTSWTAAVTGTAGADPITSVDPAG